MVMKQKSISDIKKHLIDALAFLEVGAYKAVVNACGEIIDIFDTARYDGDIDEDKWNEEDEDRPDDDEW